MTSSPVYGIEILCEQTQAPAVRVLSPPLEERSPHIYPDGSLCLYWPKEWKWSPKELLALTILPWTASWLYFYELWLDTGAWLGTSSHDAQLQGGWQRAA